MDDMLPFPPAQQMPSIVYSHQASTNTALPYDSTMSTLPVQHSNHPAYYAQPYQGPQGFYPQPMNSTAQAMDGHQASPAQLLYNRRQGVMPFPAPQPPVAPDGEKVLVLRHQLQEIVNERDDAVASQKKQAMRLKKASAENTQLKQHLQDVNESLKDTQAVGEQYRKAYLDLIVQTRDFKERAAAQVQDAKREATMWKNEATRLKGTDAPQSYDSNEDAKNASSSEYPFVSLPTMTPPAHATHSTSSNHNETIDPGLLRSSPVLSNKSPGRSSSAAMSSPPYQFVSLSTLSSSAHASPSASLDNINDATNPGLVSSSPTTPNASSSRSSLAGLASSPITIDDSPEPRLHKTLASSVSSGHVKGTTTMSVPSPASAVSKSPIIVNRVSIPGPTPQETLASMTSSSLVTGRKLMSIPSPSKKKQAAKKPRSISTPEQASTISKPGNAFKPLHSPVDPVAQEIHKSIKRKASSASWLESSGKKRQRQEVEAEHQRAIQLSTKLSSRSSQKKKQNKDEKKDQKLRQELNLVGCSEEELAMAGMTREEQKKWVEEDIREIHEIEAAAEAKRKAIYEVKTRDKDDPEFGAASNTKRSDKRKTASTSRCATPLLTFEAGNGKMSSKSHCDTADSRLEVDKQNMPSTSGPATPLLAAFKALREQFAGKKPSKSDHTTSTPTVEEADNDSLFGSDDEEADWPVSPSMHDLPSTSAFTTPMPMDLNEWDWNEDDDDEEDESGFEKVVPSELSAEELAAQELAAQKELDDVLAMEGDDKMDAEGEDDSAVEREEIMAVDDDKTFEDESESEISEEE